MTYAEMVSGIEAGDQDAAAELYNHFARGLRFTIARSLGVGVDDILQDVMLILLEQIRAGQLREPDRLPGYIRTITRREIAAEIGRRVEARKDSSIESPLTGNIAFPGDSPDPEQLAAAAERIAIAERILRAMAPDQREILTRFYRRGESQESICREMGLDGTQFRLAKSRAKSEYQRRVSNALRPRPILRRFRGGRAVHH